MFTDAQIRGTQKADKLADIGGLYLYVMVVLVENSNSNVTVMQSD
jgi:hypothetical protein